MNRISSLASVLAIAFVGCQTPIADHEKTLPPRLAALQSKCPGHYTFELNSKNEPVSVDLTGFCFLPEVGSNKWLIHRGDRELRSNSQVTHEHLSAIASVASLKRVSLYGADITEANFGELRSSNVEELRMAGAKPTTAQLTILGSCESLKELDLRDAEISHEGWLAISKLPRLEKLVLLGKELDTAPNDILQKFKSLKSIEIHQGLQESKHWERRNSNGLPIDIQYMAPQGGII